MTDDNKSKETATLEKIEQFLSSQRRSEFTEEDTEALHRIIKLIQGFEALGSLAGFIKSVLIWIGVVVSSYIMFKTGAIEFILHAVQGAK